MVATILLVVITVVLAALLYVLAVGMTSRVAGTPLGTALAFGPATNVSSSGPHPGCPELLECYVLPIVTASGGVSGGALTFAAKSPGGASAVTVNWSYTLVDASGGPVNVTWHGADPCVGANCSAPLTSGEQVLLTTNATASLSGYVLVAVGGAPYMGTVDSFPLPL